MVNSKKKKTLALLNGPHRKGVVKKISIMTPRKPNSAKRKVAKIKFTIAKGKIVYVYIPGENHTLKPFAQVLVRGGVTKDLPGLNYKVIHGKFDLQPLKNKKNSRSKYGVKKKK